MFVLPVVVKAQEMIVPLGYNPLLEKVTQEFASKKTRLTLPFIDDFSYPGPYPDPTLWEDKMVYINNTMSATPVTRGVATFDGLNSKGRPYYPSFFSSGPVDSLTSKPIDLSTYLPSSNIFLSFFYQPQGLGFAPENLDSLFLYFRDTDNNWDRIWEARGTPLQPFRIVLNEVTDPQYLHDSFQFRFVNIASMNTNDDIWNIDYVKLDANRSKSDSIMNDVAFTVEPGSILFPYSSMPYRHFMANQANEVSQNQSLEIRNFNNLANNETTHHQAFEFISNTPISNAQLPQQLIGAKSSITQAIPSYPISYTAPTTKSKVVIRNKYYFDPISSQDRRQNDTISRDAIFDNYFAYDDGSAEKSYFLLPAFNNPSKTALQFSLNESDTLRGLMIHFGPQLPSAAGKFFSIVLYNSLGSGAANDSIIQQEDLFQVMYDSNLNGFTTYAFTNPVALQKGTYFLGITQPANFGSDSLYYGLDVNNQTNAQYLYFNVDGTWATSSASGSVMMRPMVGQYFTPSIVKPIQISNTELVLYPNPVDDQIWIKSTTKWSRYSIFDLNGQLKMQGNLDRQTPTIPLAGLNTGIYFISCVDQQGHKQVNQFIKK